MNVRFTPASGQAEIFRYVSSAEGCASVPEQGWYYDVPAAPTQVRLCPETCARVSSSPDARVAVLFGCRRVDVN